MTKKTQGKANKCHTQKQCDDLLTPIIKLMHPECMLCGQPTQVAHHFIKKSVSSNLRYNLKNLCNLCNSCHFKLHFNDEGLWNGKIALIKGKKWLKYLEDNKKQHTTQKYDYNVIYEDLKSKLEKLKNTI